MEKKEILVDGIKISLLVGSNYNYENPTIFLHGWGQNKHSFQRTLDYYENKNISYISIDLPGFGESPKPDDSWGINEYAILMEKISKLFNIQKINIVGHGFGGEIGIYASSNNILKIDKLVLIASGGKKTKFGKLKYNLRKLAKNLLIKIGLHWLVKNIKTTITTSTYTNSKTMEKIFNNTKNNSNIQLGKIDSPTLIIWGTKDKYNNFSNGMYINEKIKNSNLFKIDGGDHFIHIQNANFVTKKIIEFIYELN
ncbi:MAG: alpha/beta hydrolase [Candidatus Absconditabacteria bacterium]